MKPYPTIPKKVDRSISIYAWDKLDGSNIRAEWSKGSGWYKFGSRKRLLDETDEHLGEAKQLILATQAEQLEAIFRKQRWQRVVAFFEFWGPNSFAGQHVDEEHQTTLIDVNPHKMGILTPREFRDLFSELPIPALLYTGRVGPDFEQEVRSGTLPGLTGEGVVCKGVRKGRHLTMFKIKTDAWLERLRDFCKGDEKKFGQLA